MLTEEQLAMRRTGIGASEIPMLIGESPHGGRVALWLRKVGLEEFTPSTKAQDVGNFLEEGLAQLYAHSTGATVEHATTLRHPEYSWALATPDRWVNGRAKILQIKVVGKYMEHHWSDSVTGYPAYYEAQVQWEMFVAGVQSCDLMALFGGTDYQIYPVARDDELIAYLFEEARDFWFNYVVPRKMPEVDSSEACTRYLRKAFPKSNGIILQATPEQEVLAARYFAAKKEKAAREEEYEMIANQFRLAIGANDGIEGPSWYATNPSLKGGGRRFGLKQKKGKKAA